MKNSLITFLVSLISVSISAQEPMIVAHRGASKDAPENTLPAFRLAWEQGADAIEGDFHQTRDGRIVCIHDKDTKKVSDKNLLISDSTLAELRQLDVGAYHGSAFRGTVIPTIAEVFSIVPDQKKIFIEIKSDETIIPILLNEIKKSDLKLEQIVVISFNAKVIQTLKSKAPQYKASWLSGFKTDDTGEIMPTLESVLKTLKEIKAEGFSSHSDIPRPFIKGIEEHGYEWHVWTVDDLNAARRFKKWGAKSITTNVPEHIKKNL
ncbi:glycerophosphodiester phosphodiesterase [Verrucomicrobia bacterium]|jgi:glycerophosphoryl diester phosphodiesterase|nr:glycerophosphodiester phosphodiesterase [Verrucomicrobiota bacterium]